MAGNPFLAMSEDFGSAAQNDALNPFLTGDFGAVESAANDNPFAMSNPFSDFGVMDQDANITVTTSVDFFGIAEPVATTAGNFFSTTIHDAYDHPGPEPLFSTSAVTTSSGNFFDTTIHEQPLMIPSTAPSMVQKPTELVLTMTNTIAESDDMTHMYPSDDELKPTRPPPPSRPIAPETKDLILSVTGHMDYTSSHLLDRIPPTRTPSPVSMRDLHSPSPTPEHAFGDFLGDTDLRKDHNGSNNSGMNLFDVDDVVTQVSCTPQQYSSPGTEIDFMASQLSNHSTSPVPITVSSRDASPKDDHAAVARPPPPRPGPPPVRPSPPARPARPLPPQKPPPPNVIPHRPPPIVPISNVNNVKPPAVSPSNDFNLFDAPPVPAVPVKSTKEDILSLYSTPKKQEAPVKQIDFLSDDIPDLPMQQESPAVVNEIQAPIEHVTPVETTNHQFDKPQPMDITPNSEDNPTTEHMDNEKQNIAEIEEPAKPMDDFSAPENVQVTRTSIDASFYTQPVVTSQSVEPPFSSEPMVTETQCTFNPQPVYEDVQSTFNPQPVYEDVQSTFNPQPVYEDVQSTFNPQPVYEDEEEAQQNFNASECNPFSAEVKSASNDMFNDSMGAGDQPTNIFGVDAPPSNDAANNGGFASIFGGEPQTNESPFGAEPTPRTDAFPAQAHDAFDAFSAKFESSANKDAAFDAFGGSAAVAPDDAWGNTAAGFSAGGDGFGVDDSFDAFLTLSEPPPVPTGTPAPFGKNDSQESDEGNFNVFIKPRDGDVPYDSGGGVVPVLAPPPARSPAPSYTDSSPRINPFDKGANFAEAAFGAHMDQQAEGRPIVQRSESQETPPTPLFDEDTSQPLEDFPRVLYDGPGWEVQLRQPNKKKITGQRFWKKIFIRLVNQGDNPVVQLLNSATDKEPFQELPLQACYSVSDIAAQQYDQYGKIFTVKLQYIFYKERPGVRPGQVTKAERITNKLSQFAAYAIQGDYQGVKEFGSDLKKLGLPVEHAPQVSQLFKIGSITYEDMKQFSMTIEEALFRLNAHRDRALHYKMEEVQITAVDEIYVEQDSEGHVLKQIARVRLLFLGFLSGMPDVELGVNDMWRQGKEVVGRHDIIPVATEEWIRLEAVEFHSCVQPDEYQKTRIIRFKPPDACYIELMRFRVRPPKNRELPLQVKAVMCVTGNKVELRADVLVPGFTSRSLGQVPCEDVMIRFPIPECWIYLFRVEKHFRYGSVKSAHRRTGKIKGIERFLGAVDTLQESLIEVTSGQAKYEHQHRSIVWRMARLPKEGQGAYTTHNLVCRMALTSYDQIPDKLADWCYVEFTMPATQVSHTVVRSVSLQNHDSDDPPEKYVRYLARHEYKVGIEHTQGEGPNAYLAATIAKPLREEPVQEVEHTPAPPSSDSDSD